MTWNNVKKTLNRTTLLALAILAIGLGAGFNSLAGNVTLIGYTYDPMGQLEKAAFQIYSTFSNGTSLYGTATQDYVYDNMGNRLILETYTTSAPSNSAPYQAVIVSPLDNQTAIDFNGTTLFWGYTGVYADPDGDDVAYSLYFGTYSTALPLVWSGTQASYATGLLASHEQHFWRVDTVDSHNALTAGARWSFTTNEYSDSDGDGVYDAFDNCTSVSNPNQADAGDGDGVGDVCDNCRFIYNPDQATGPEYYGYGSACAKFWNVTTAGQLKFILDDVNQDGVHNNGKHDVIRIAGAEGSGKVYYGGFWLYGKQMGTELDSIIILGGYSPDFTERDPEKYVTILDGNNSNQVLCFKNQANTERASYSQLVIDGLTIRNGYASGTNANGGGLHVEWQRGTVQITNNIFTGNHAGNGGAVDIGHSTNNEPLIFTGNIVSNNVASSGGGGLRVSFQEQTSHKTYCSYNVFSNNSSNGYGGAAYIGNRAYFTHNRVCGNSAMYGGGAHFAGKYVLVSDNLIYDNVMTYTGAQYYDGGGLELFSNGSNDKVDIINNTIVSNSSPKNAGGIYIRAVGNPVTANLYNNIVRNNTTGSNKDIYVYDPVAGLTLNLFYNDYGTRNSCSNLNLYGNLNTDPKFLDSANDDYRLDEDSPLIDAGYTSAPNLSSTDFDGDARVLGSAVDIGADEYYLDTEPPFSYILTPANGTVLTNYTCIVTGTAFDIGYGVADVKVLVSTDAFANNSTIYQAEDKSSNGSWSGWEYGWTAPGSGVYQIKSRATDAVGNVDYRSAPVTVSVNSPWISSLAPETDVMPSSTPYQIGYTVFGAYSSNVTVSFYNYTGTTAGRLLIGSQQVTLAGNSYTGSYPWSWTDLPVDDYYVSATVTDGGSGSHTANSNGALSVVGDYNMCQNYSNAMFALYSTADSDYDNDGLTNCEEVNGTKNVNFGYEPTDLTDPDSDDDGFSDYAECVTYGTDPNTADTTAPTSSIDQPAGTLTGASYTLTGDADDGEDGSGVDLVELSFDDETWVPLANTTWSYDWTLPSVESYIPIRSRATDVLNHVETPGAGITVLVDNAGPVPDGWVRQLGTNSNDKAYDACTDSSGNVYAVGTTRKGMDGHASAGLYDIFVIKYQPDGTKLWSRQIGTSASEYALGVCYEPLNDQIFVAGYTGGGLNGQTNSGGDDAFVLQYEADGDLGWTRLIGTTEYDYAEGVAVDSSGDVYVTGYTDGDLDGTSIGDFDLFVAKLAGSDGSVIWKQQKGTGDADYGYDICADASDNIYVTGHTYGDFGATNSGGSDMFVARFDTYSSVVWTRQLGGTNGDETYGVSTDSSGNVYVAGATYSDLDGQTNSGTWDMFVTKYDSSGNKSWTRLLGTTEGDYAMDACQGANSGVYVAGYTRGGIGGNGNAGNWDLCFANYSTNGDTVWVRQTGTGSYDFGYGICADGSGNVILAGNTYGDMEAASKQGYADFFVLKQADQAVVINGGDAVTTSTSVTLTLSANDASTVDEMMISNDGVFDTESWETYSSSKAWTLTSGNGTKTVYVKFRDGNDTESSTYSDTIELQQ